MGHHNLGVVRDCISTTHFYYTTTIMVHTYGIPIARYLPVPHWLPIFQALETFPLICIDRHRWLGPRRTNCTPPARLVRRWDRQERTARISGPTFRCPVLCGQTNSGEPAPKGPQMGPRCRLSRNGTLRLSISTDRTTNAPDVAPEMRFLIRLRD